MSDACCNNEPAVVPSAKQDKQIKSFYIDKEYGLAIVSFILLMIGIVLKEWLEVSWFTPAIQIVLFGIAYLLVGGPVVWKAIKLIGKGDIFNEFFLMSIATIGAFLLGEYAEGVAVMLFYAVGELFQGAAVNRAKRSIEALLKIQAQEVTVISNGRSIVKHPTAVQVGEYIQVKPGEKVALDGELVSEKAILNTAALTGESVPEVKYKGGSVLAGMINLEQVSDILVTRRFEDTKLSQILKMVQEAASRKAPTQRFISKFAKIYTPIVVFLALALTFLPYFIVETYIFREWLYRALVFLVISCPCALVVSIPLGYFGGIGAASRNGILFKGSNYLDLLRKVDTVVMDKTGTLTKGVFKVQRIEAIGIDQKEMLRLVAALESKSTHPVARAITAFQPNENGVIVENAEEIAGHGMSGIVAGRQVLAGNIRLLKKYGIPFDANLEELAETTVVVAIDSIYKGYIVIADELKEDAHLAIAALRKAGVKRLVMLSGDRNALVQKVAQSLNLDAAVGELLPEGKVKELEKLKQHSKVLAFAGDGINDAPVITLADVGLAMGGLGSDASIETADVVIQNDQPSKIATAISIGRATHNIVWQNIGFAFGVKILVLALGAYGVASMWEAVFADVGVALLAILNAVRIQRMNF